VCLQKKNSFQAEVMTSLLKNLSTSWQILSLTERHSFEKQRRFCLQNPLSSIPPFTRGEKEKVLTESNSSLGERQKRERGMINLNAPPSLLFIYVFFHRLRAAGQQKSIFGRAWLVKSAGYATGSAAASGWVGGRAGGRAE